MSEPIAIIAQKFSEIVIPLVNAAQKSIRIIVYDWRFYPSVDGSSVSQFNAAIVAAAKRGVQVQALVNSDSVISILKQKGIEARRVHSARTLHTKMLLIDDTNLVIGSHNYTQNAFALNHEASIFVPLLLVDNAFTQYFDNLWGV